MVNFPELVFMVSSCLGKSGFGLRLPHQPTQALAPNIPATVTQLQTQLALPVKRPAQVQRIQIPHPLQLPGEGAHEPQ